LIRGWQKTPTKFVGGAGFVKNGQLGGAGGFPTWSIWNRWSS
jgi:hypothetical protein